MPNIVVEYVTRLQFGTIVIEEKTVKKNHGIKTCDQDTGQAKRMQYVTVLSLLYLFHRTNPHWLCIVQPL